MCMSDVRVCHPSSQSPSDLACKIGKARGRYPVSVTTVIMVSGHPNFPVFPHRCTLIHSKADRNLSPVAL